MCGAGEWLLLPFIGRNIDPHSSSRCILIAACQESDSDNSLHRQVHGRTHHRQCESVLSCIAACSQSQSHLPNILVRVPWGLAYSHTRRDWHCALSSDQQHLGHILRHIRKDTQPQSRAYRALTVWLQVYCLYSLQLFFACALSPLWPSYHCFQSHQK